MTHGFLAAGFISEKHFFFQQQEMRIELHDRCLVLVNLSYCDLICNSKIANGELSCVYKNEFKKIIHM